MARGVVTMASRRPITLPRIGGKASRQAHVDLPENSYERELGREGFYGPATQMYHRHPPTGWSKVEGPLRPRAFDTTMLEHEAASADSRCGCSCLGEKRVIEIIEHGTARTEYLKVGDKVRISMWDAYGHSIFGDIEQEVIQWRG